MMGLVLYLLVLSLAGAAYRKRPVGLAVWFLLATGLYAVTTGTAWAVFAIILLSLLLGQPLYVVLGGLTLYCFYFLTGYTEADTLNIIIAKILELASKEVLLAIPFFVVAGEIMTQGSLAQRLIDVARAVFGFMPGGLAVAAVAGCVFFAAISGSSPVTVIAIGSIMVPALVRAGYPFPFAMGLLTTAGSLGILIPPSIPMIVYSIMVGTTTPMDPKDLFLGGVVPGLLIGLLLALYSAWVGVRHKIPREPWSLAHVGRELTRGVWSLLLPVLILGGIYSGVFTTTEAAGVSVVYAFIVETFIHRDMQLRQLAKVAENSMTTMGALLIIIGLAIGLNHVLVEEQVPDQMVQWLQGLELSRTTFLIVVNLFLLVLGCFMDIMSAILIVAPMIAPMAASMGIDPIHMGIIFIVNLEIGYLTPPIGLNLFVATTLFRRSLGEVIVAVLPTLVIMFMGLLLITWIPPLSTGLVRFLEGDSSTEAVPPASGPAMPHQPAQDVPPAGSGGRVKSLQELMQEQRGGGDAGAPSSSSARVKTLQELMAEQRANQAPPTAEQKPVSRVKTLQELMAEQRERNGAVQTGSTDDGGTP